MPHYNDPKYSGDVYGDTGFPSKPKVFLQKTDLIDEVMAWHVNSPQEEITAIQTELGLDPADTHSTVVERIDRIGQLIRCDPPLCPPQWSYTSDPHSTTAVLNMNIATEFGLPTGLKAVQIRLTTWDPGVWGYYYACFGPTAALYYQVASYPLGYNMFNTCGGSILNVGDNDTVYYKFQASGTDTLHCQLEIHGYYLK